ncbi:MAG: hypothetical protein ACLS8D_03075 [Clostridioides difficile]
MREKMSEKQILLDIVSFIKKNKSDEEIQLMMDTLHKEEISEFNGLFLKMNLMRKKY